MHASTSIDIIRDRDRWNPSMSFAFDRYPIACNAHARRGHPSMPSHPSTSIDIIRDRWNPSMSFAFDRYRYPIARSPMHPSTCIIRDRMESIERNPSNGIESNGLRSRSIDRIDRSIVAVARGRARRRRHIGPSPACILIRRRTTTAT